MVFPDVVNFSRRRSQNTNASRCERCAKSRDIYDLVLAHTFSLMGGNFHLEPYTRFWGENRVTTLQGQGMDSEV